MGVEGGRARGGGRRRKRMRKGPVASHFHNGKVKRTSAPNLSSPPRPPRSPPPVPSLPLCAPDEGHICKMKAAGMCGAEEGCVETNKAKLKSHSSAS